MYSAAMSPPRCPVPRPSSKSLARNFTCARILSLSISGVPAGDAAALPGAAAVFPCAAARLVISETQTNASREDKQATAYFFMETPQPRKELFFRAIFEQILQLAHELLHILKVHVHRREPHVRHFFVLRHFAQFPQRQSFMRQQRCTDKTAGGEGYKVKNDCRGSRRFLFYSNDCRVGKNRCQLRTAADSGQLEDRAH